MPHEYVPCENYLPTGALFRFGKGRIYDVTVSPNQEVLAIASSIGVYGYDFATLQERWFYPTCGIVTEVVFHPDGMTLLASTPTDILRLQIDTGKLVQFYDSGLVEDIEFLDSDGSAFIANVTPGTSTIGWQTLTGEEFDLALDTWIAAVSPSKKLIAINTWPPPNRTVVIQNGVDGEIIRTIEEKGKDVYALSFSIDGSLIVTETQTDNQSSTLEIQNIDSGDIVLTISAPDSDCADIQISSDNSFVMCVNSTGDEIPIWEISTGSMAIIEHELNNALTTLLFDPSGKTILALSSDHRLLMWNVRTHLSLQAPTDPLCRDNFCRLKFTPDGKRIVIWDTGSISLWDPALGTIEQSFAQEFYGRMTNLVYSPDGDYLLGSIPDREQLIRLNVRTTERTIIPLSAAGGSNGYHVSDHISPDHQTYALINEFVELYDTQTGRLIYTFDDIESPLTFVYSSDGSHLAVVDKEKHQMSVFNITGNTVVKRITLLETIDQIGFTHAGDLVAAVSTENTVSFLNVATGEKVVLDQGVKCDWYSCAFSPDGSFFGVSTRLWDTTTGKIVKELEGCTVFCGGAVNFSPTGKLYYVSYPPEPLFLWDLPSGDLRQVLEGEDMFLTNQISPDESMIAIAEGFWEAYFTPDIQTLSLWDISTGQLLDRFAGHTDAIRAIAFSPDGSTLATASNDGTIILWPINR